MHSAQKKRTTALHHEGKNSFDYIHRSNVIVQIFQLNREEIEKIISISIDYLDSLDGDPDLEQDIIVEHNGDEDDYTILEWHNPIN